MGVGRLVSRGRGDGIGSFWRGSKERGKHLKCKQRKYLIKSLEKKNKVSLLLSHPSYFSEHSPYCYQGTLYTLSLPTYELNSLKNWSAKCAVSRTGLPSVPHGAYRDTLRTTRNWNLTAECVSPGFKPSTFSVSPLLERGVAAKGRELHMSHAWPAKKPRNTRRS